MWPGTVHTDCVIEGKLLFPPSHKSRMTLQQDSRGVYSVYLAFIRFGQTKFVYFLEYGLIDAVGVWNERAKRRINVLF